MMMMMMFCFLLIPRYYRRPAALLFLVVVCLPSRCYNNKHVVVDALSVSTDDNNHRRRRVDYQSGGHNNPRRLLATEWIAEKMIGIGTRFILLAPPSLLPIKRLVRRSADGDCNNNNNKNIISVRVKGKSNRQILQGNLQNIIINVNNSHGLLFDIDSLSLQSSDVTLGLWPLVLLTSIPILFSLRPSPLLVLFLYWFYRSKTYSSMFRTTENNKIGRPLPGSMLIRRFFKSLKKRLDGEGKSPWSMKYKLCLSQANINQSQLFRFGLKQVLRSLMLNSVLKVAAVTGDTMNQLQKEMDNNNNNNNNNSNQNSRFLRLNPSSSGGRNDSDVATPQSSSSSPRPRPPEPVLTKLLEATNFELDNVTLDSKDGHVIMDANAIMEDKSTSFSYTLRVIPESTRVVTMLNNNNNNNMQQQQQQQYALAFAKPECRFATSALVQGGGILEKFLPDLWIPVGPGVALPLGTRHRIENVCIVPSSGSSSGSSSSDKNNKDDKSAESCCEIVGRFSFNNNESSSIITTGGGGSSGGPSSQRKALPPSSG